MNDIEKRPQFVDFMQFPGERTAQIESKTIDMHLVDPVTQRIHDQLQYMRRLHIQRIATAGVVHVKSTI